jgi:hypothetical protein
MGAAPSVVEGEEMAARDDDGTGNDRVSAGEDSDSRNGQMTSEEQDVGNPELQKADRANENEQDSKRARKGRVKSDPKAPELPPPHFETTEELFGQWNLPSINAIIACEKDFLDMKQDLEDDANSFPLPPTAVVLDERLISLLRRICRVHSSTHKVQLNAERDAGSLRSGKKSLASANPIKILYRRMTELEKFIENGLALTGDTDESSDAQSAFQSATSSAIIQRHWTYPSPLQLPDVDVSLGGKFGVKGFDVRVCGATRCLVAVESVRSHGLAEVMNDALACSGIGVHPNILMLISAQRKMLWRDAAAAAGQEEAAVELTWEYVKGYTLEKAIISGMLFVPAHRPSPELDLQLKR